MSDSTCGAYVLVFLASARQTLSTLAMASLDGVVSDWDGSQVIRARMRETQILLQPLPLMDEVKITVACGEHNYDALAPLAKRLRDPDTGNVEMFSVPHIMHQLLWLDFGHIVFNNLLCFRGRLL